MPGLLFTVGLLILFVIVIFLALRHRVPANHPRHAKLPKRWGKAHDER